MATAKKKRDLGENAAGVRHCAFTPSQIELVKVQTLDQLDEAKKRLDEAAFEAAMPGGDDSTFNAVQAEVETLRAKLVGLNHGLERAKAAERRREEEERQKRRRGAAVKALDLMHRRSRAVAKLDAALAEASAAHEEVRDLGRQIHRHVGPWFDGRDRGEDHRNNFLMAIGALGLTDIAYRVDTDLGDRYGNYSRFLYFSRENALRALANVMPEALDEAVQAEAKAMSHEDGDQGEAAE